MSHSEKYLERHHPRTHTARIILVVTVTIVVLWVVAVMVSATQVFAHMLDARDALIQAKEEATAFSFTSASSSLERAEEAFAASERFLPVLSSVSWVPVVGHTMASVSDVVRSGHDLVEALQPFFDLGEDVVQLSGLSDAYLAQMNEGLVPTVTFGDLSTQTKRAMLTRLSASAEDLDLLFARLDLVSQELTILAQESPIGPVLTLMDPLRVQVNELTAELDFLRSLVRLLPTFAGLEDEATSLLLFLNNNELRPGGGFMGTYGVLKTSGGDITELETTDVYALDDAASDTVTRTAPSPLQRYNETTKWFFRDSNWSPDFAVSSMTASAMFLEEGGVPVENVIGFTPTFAADLLAITGPITVGGQTFTPENVADALEYQVEYGYAESGKPVAQRKEILADLVNEMKARLYALPSASWQKVFDVTQKALDEKQLLLFSSVGEVENVITRLGWGGSVDSTTVDALMIVDANLASLKSDPAVKREVTYTLEKDSSDQWIGRVSIHYIHTGDFDWKTTRYRTYTRVYLPVGTELIDVEGSWLNDKTQNPTGAKGPVDVEQELGLTSFGTFTSVEPGEENTLTFTVALSPQVIETIHNGDYALSVLKQAGAQNNALTLDLNFDKNVTHATPSEDEGEWGDAAYRLNTILDQDLQIGIRL